MTEPLEDPVDDRRADQDRDVSDVGLPGPGDATAPDTDADEAALDAQFPPRDATGG